MCRWILLPLFLLHASSAWAQDAPLPVVEVLRIVHADMAKIPLADRRHFRYFDQHYLPDKNGREKNARILSGHINGLSRESDLVRPFVVDPDCWVLRIDLREYRLDPKVYEQLADADPMYHVKTVIETVTEVEERTPWPGGVYKPENKYYDKGAFNLVTKKKVVEKKEIKTALAPILTEGEGLALTAELVKWTGSSVFVLPMEFFFNQSAAQVDRNPGYYDFLGIKDEKAFQKLIGFDAKVAADFGLTELREAVADSAVTLQPRAIRRDEKIGGAYWRTFDFDKAVDRKNPLRVLGVEIEADYTADETYGHLANGLFAMGLFNKKGERQATAPDTVASDSTSKSTDRRVHVCASCTRCHSNGQLQDIDGWTRSLFDGPPLTLQSPDFDVQKRLRQQYVRKLEPFIKADRERYETAIKEATGWTGVEYSAAFSEYWEQYEDAKVDLAWMAARLSVKPEHFRAALVEYAKRTNNLDLVLAGLLKGKTCKVRQGEEVFQSAYLVMKGYVVK